jgi:hypothetical protein
MERNRRVLMRLRWLRWRAGARVCWIARRSLSPGGALRQSVGGR